MNIDTRKAVIGFTLGGLIFWLLTRTFFKKEERETYQPAITDENVSIALTAYMSATENGENQSVLNDLNAATAKDYGLRIYQRKADGKFIVTDLSGKEIKEV